MGFLKTIATIFNLNNVATNVIKQQTVVKNTIAKKTTVKKTVEISNKKQYPNLLVIADPGHAVSTPGKGSPYSLGYKNSPMIAFKEWEWNREITNRMKEELEKYGIEVFITTTDSDKDADILLTTRATRGVNYAKKSGKKAIFISTHANAHGNGNEWTSANGWSTYTTKGQNESDVLAEYFYDQAEELLKKPGKMTIRTDKSDGDRDAEENFTVIYKTEKLWLKNGKPVIPAILCEHGFYTNINDCTFMISEEGKQTIVDLCVRAILKYADERLKM